jgi:hypothetical protein
MMPDVTASGVAAKDHRPAPPGGRPTAEEVAATLQAISLHNH